MYVGMVVGVVAIGVGVVGVVVVVGVVAVRVGVVGVVGAVALVAVSHWTLRWSLGGAVLLRVTLLDHGEYVQSRVELLHISCCLFFVFSETHTEVTH